MIAGAKCIARFLHLSNDLEGMMGVRAPIRELWVDRRVYEAIYWELSKQAQVTVDAEPRDGKISTGLIRLHRDGPDIILRQAD